MAIPDLIYCGPLRGSLPAQYCILECRQDNKLLFKPTGPHLKNCFSSQGSREPTHPGILVIFSPLDASWIRRLITTLAWGFEGGQGYMLK